MPVPKILQNRKSGAINFLIETCHYTDYSGPLAHSRVGRVIFTEGHRSLECAYRLRQSF